MFKLIILFGLNGSILVVGFPKPENSSSSTPNKVSLKNTDDFLLEVPQLIEKYGYPIETHEIKTEDGYLISMHRIPGQKVNSKGIGFGIPVMLMHGLFGSSSCWIDNGPKNALAYILADDGYDVWMANTRGSRYSRKHVSLDPDKGGEYWQFSWHEIGYYDLPACIDHILAETKKDKLHYVGHSQGTTVFFVMASTKPKYNEKISLMQALAPVAFNSHSRNQLIDVTRPLYNLFARAVPILGIYELRYPDGMVKFMVHELCNSTSVLFPICITMFYISFGYNPGELNATKIPLYGIHSSYGISSRQQIHYAQVYDSGKFQQFDYGETENVLKYGQAMPPDYDLSKITAPVALHYSENDMLSDTIDVKNLYNKLGNPIGLFKVPLKTFAHLDYIWGINAPALVYGLIRKLLTEY